MIAILYNILNTLLLPVYFIILGFRLLKNKEDKNSITARLGIYKTPRPAGKLIWLHAASVGESTVALTLIKAIGEIYPQINFLITTNTLHSGNIVKKQLPENACHQFIPIDNVFFVRKFLDHWKPNLGLFIESELWPCLTKQAASRFHLLLVNARLSDKSFDRWKKWQKSFKFITDNFTKILAQSKLDADKYKTIGALNVRNLGNLKFANGKLEFDKNKLKELQKLFSGKKVFVAASTHEEDEEVVLEVIEKLRQQYSDFYPIMIPRHPTRKDDIVKKCTDMGLKISLDSKSLPGFSDDLFIVDSFGKLGLYYSLADIVFVGGSFKRGGHNLVEPAYFDNVIILGADMSNFRNITDEMIEQKAAIRIKNSDELAGKISYFLNNDNKTEKKQMIANAREFVKNRQQTLDNYLSVITDFI